MYNSWTMQLNILMRLLSVPHECWCCIETFLGFLNPTPVLTEPPHYNEPPHIHRTLGPETACTRIHRTIPQKLQLVRQCVSSLWSVIWTEE